MIDIQVFQSLLLWVCILAFIGSVFAGSVMTSSLPWLRLVIKLFFAVLGIASGVAGLVLVMLK